MSQSPTIMTNSILSSVSNSVDITEYSSSQRKQADNYVSEKIKNSEVFKDAVKEAPETKRKGLFSSDIRDPLSVVDDLLDKYFTDKTNSAQKIADEIAKKGDAIAEINRLWGLIKTATLNSGLDTTSNDGKPLVDPKLNDGQTPEKALARIEDLIKNTLGDSRGIGAIILPSFDTGDVNYSELETLSANVTNYCDKIKVDLDTKEQEFSNTMTKISSVQEEIRDLHRFIVSMFQR